MTSGDEINATVADGAGNSAATCSGRRSPYAHTHLGLDEAAHHLGRAGEALAAARTGREAVEAQEERGHLAWAERVLGDALSAGAPREAMPHYRRAAEINGALGMRPELELASPAPASRGSGAADPGEDDPPRRSSQGRGRPRVAADPGQIAEFREGPASRPWPERMVRRAVA